jgi:hypothetical protein
MPTTAPITIFVRRGVAVAEALSKEIAVAVAAPLRIPVVVRLDETKLNPPF